MKTTFSLAILAAVTLLVLAPTVCDAVVRGTELYVPSVARSPGAGGSIWYTTVWVHNPGDAAALVTVSLLRRGQANPAPDQQYLTVEAGRTVTVGDLLWDLFGVEQGAGAARFASDRAVAVSARVFNLPGSDIAESQGQFLAGTPAEMALAEGDATDIAGITQPADGSFRCNFGLVETTGQSVAVRVTLLDQLGVELASRDYSLGPHEPLQKNLSDLGSAPTVDGGRLHLEVLAGPGRVIGFASLVASGADSQDPSTLEMETEMAAAGGGISQITAGAGLTGGGSGSEVGLAVGAGAGLAVSEDSVAIATAGIRGAMIADGEVVRGLRVDGQHLSDELTLVAGDGIVLSTNGNSVQLGVNVGFTQFELAVTTSDGAWTTVRAVGVPYGSTDGSWRLRFSISGRTWSPVSEVTLEVAGVTFKDVEQYQQPVAVYLRADRIPGIAYAVPGTNTLQVSVSNDSGKSYYNLAGDVELEGPPAFLR